MPQSPDSCQRILRWEEDRLLCHNVLTFHPQIYNQPSKYNGFLPASHHQDHCLEIRIQG